MPLPEVVANGDLRKSLEAIRDRLATELEAAPSRDCAPLAKQLAQVLHDLDGLPGEEKSDLDDLQAKRAARRASA